MEYVMCTAGSSCFKTELVMLRFSCLFFLLIAATITFSQPGGGGVLIQTIIDKNGVVVDSDDPALVIRTFVLSDTDGPSIRPYYLTEQEASYKHQTLNRGLYIYPYCYLHGSKVKAPDQVVQFMYSGDTTCFEFRDIPIPNGSGASSRIDTVQLIPGNYRFYLNIIKHYSLNTKREWDAAILDSVGRILQENRSITYATLPILQKINFLESLGNERQPVVYVKEAERYDTAYLVRKPIYYLQINAFEISSTAIQLTIDDDPLLQNGQQLYRCLLMVPAPDIAAIRNYSDEKYQKVVALFKDMKTKPLYINGTAYTGVVKFFLPFHAFMPGAGSVSGYGLSIYTFKEGKLLQEKHVPDVDIDGEYQVVRPA
jgi:hypothetical protein